MVRWVMSLVVLVGMLLLARCAVHHAVLHAAALGVVHEAAPVPVHGAVGEAHHEVSLPASLSQQVVSVSVQGLEVLVDAHQGIPAL